MGFPWFLVSIGLTYGVGYAARPLVVRAKRDSARWQQRSPDARRVLSLLPGAVAGFAMGIVLILLLDH